MRNKLQVLVAAVPGEFQEPLHECLTRAYVIMKLNNSNHSINVETYKEFCSEAKRLLLTAICLQHSIRMEKSGYF